MKRPDRRVGSPAVRWTIAVAAFVLVAVPVVPSYNFRMYLKTIPGLSLSDGRRKKVYIRASRTDRSAQTMN